MKIREKQKQWAAGQRGAGLLEVLVAVLVLGIGVLGIAALQSVALKNSGSSASTTNATIQVYAGLDLLRTVDASKLTSDTYKFNYRSASSGAEGTVDGWLSSLKATVAPDAEGKIWCEGGSNPVTCTVGVRWDDRRSGGDADRSVEISSQI